MSQNDSVTIDAPQAAPAKPRPVQKTKPKRQPPYAVVIENDDDHTFQYVIDGLCKVCGHNWVRSFLLATTIHTAGRAVVWTGSFEVAELKRDQIKGLGPDHFAPKPVNFPLGVVLEPLPD